MKSIWRDHKIALIVTIVLIGLISTSAWAWFNFNETYQEGQIIDTVNRAETAIDENNYPLAFQLLQQAISLDSENQTEYLRRQGDVAFLNSDYRLAATLYKQGGLSNTAEIMYYPALEELAKFNFVQANSLLVDVESALDPERPLKIEQINDLRSQIYEIEKEPNEPLKKAKVGKLFIEQDTYELAHQVLSSLISSEPKYRDAHYLLGVNYLKQGKLEEAKTSLNKALEIDPNYQPARDLLTGIEK